MFSVTDIFNIGGTILKANTDAKNRISTASNQLSQAQSDQTIALKNQAIMNQKINLFQTQQTEEMQDIREEGASANADQQALAAASGMGTAGSNRTRTLSIERRTERDVGRVQNFMNAQAGIMQGQADIYGEQAAEYGNQITFANKSVKTASKAKVVGMNAALKSKAILCKGLVTSFYDEVSKEKLTWKYDHGLDDYLNEYFIGKKCIFPSPFTGKVGLELGFIL